MTKRALVTLHDKLRAARQRLGKTQYEIALEAGVRPEVVSRLERGIGRGSLASLHKLCPVLGLSLDELVADTNLNAKPTVASTKAKPAPKKKGTKQ